MEWVENDEPSSLKASIKEFAKRGGNSTSDSINGFKANARIWLRTRRRSGTKELKTEKISSTN